MGEGLIVRRGGGIPADPDLIPENIRKGVEIFDVTGTLAEGDGTWAEATTFSATENRTIYSAHDNPNAVYGGSYGENSAQTVVTSRIYKGKTYVELQYVSGTPHIYTGNITINGNAITIPAGTYSNNHNIVICHI